MSHSIAMRIFLMVVLLLLAAVARADEPVLRWDARADITTTAVGAWLWIVSEEFVHDLAPARCRWCERNADGSDAVNALDRSARDALRLANPAAAESAGNTLGFVVVPLLALGLDIAAAQHERRLRDSAVDALLIIQSAIIAADVNQLIKFSVGRERPLYHYATPDQRAALDTLPDRNVSFYSGHTTLDFAMAVSAGTVASMRGYRLAPLIWTLGCSLAAVTGYLRIAADRHYLTDVLTGGAIGSAIGFVNPFLIHRARKSPVRPVVTSSDGGALVGVAGRF